MDELPEIEFAQAKQLLDDKSATFVDVRDPASFEQAHIPGALHVNDHNVQEFVATSDKQRPVVVYCYHGHSSLGATAFFIDQGFADVVSLTGGFAGWHHEGGPEEAGPPGE